MVDHELNSERDLMRTPTTNEKIYKSLSGPTPVKKKMPKNNSLICIHSSYTKLNNVNMVNIDPPQDYFKNFYQMSQKTQDL